MMKIKLIFSHFRFLFPATQMSTLSNMSPYVCYNSKQVYFIHLSVSNTQYPTFQKIFSYVMRGIHTKYMIVVFVMQDNDFNEILRDL